MTKRVAYAKKYKPKVSAEKAATDLGWGISVVAFLTAATVYLLDRFGLAIWPEVANGYVTASIAGVWGGALRGLRDLLKHKYDWDLKEFLKPLAPLVIFLLIGPVLAFLAGCQSTFGTGLNIGIGFSNGALEISGSIGLKPSPEKPSETSPPMDAPVE